MFCVQVHQRTIIQKIMTRMLNATIAAAFRAWSEMKRQAQLCRRILKRLTNKLMLAVMNQWADTAVELKETRVKVTRIMKRFLNAVSAHAVRQLLEILFDRVFVIHGSSLAECL